MSESDQNRTANLFRVGTAGAPAYQLRSGEEGLSVFAEDGVFPPLTEEELLAVFRPGSVVLVRPLTDIMGLGLEVVIVEGAETLPERLRQAHREIRPALGMTRTQFKQALKRIE